jgi:hypothetical protein
MANQGHGFLWENAITRDVFHLEEALAYTSVFDLDAAHNTLDPEENVSIKVACGDKVECGDASRIFSYADTGVTMIHIQCRQRDSGTKELVRLREFRLGGAEAHQLLFGTVTQEEINALATMTRAIPAGPIAAATKAAVHAEKRRLNAKSGGIRFNPKMDSKSQRRLQCSIPKLSAFLTANPSLVISDTAQPLLRGIAIPPTVPSGPRRRNPRVNAAQ